jgi:hypothetical protein
MVVISTYREGWSQPPGEPSPMPYERDPRPGAAGWTTILGLCLALVAAGSFIAFSLVARDATGPLAPLVDAVAPASSSVPVIRFDQPRKSRDDGVRPSADGRSIVLGRRLEEGPVITSTEDKTREGTKADGCTRCGTRSSGAVADNDDDPVAIPTRKTTYSKSGGSGKSKPSPTSHSPQGKAKGHHKSNGKGHSKHPHR